MENYLCTVFQKELQYLGYRIYVEGIDADSMKIKDTVEWIVPKNAQEVRSFMGLVRYYTKFTYRFF